MPIEKEGMDAFRRGVKIVRSERGTTIIGTARFLSDQPFKYYKDNEKGLLECLQKNKITVSDTTIKAEYAIPMGVFVKCIPSCTNMEDTISELKEIRWPKETPREERIKWDCRVIPRFASMPTEAGKKYVTRVLVPEAAKEQEKEMLENLQGMDPENDWVRKHCPITRDFQFIRRAKRAITFVPRVSAVRTLSVYIRYTLIRKICVWASVDTNATS